MNVWEWVKAHAPLLLAGGVGLVAAYYLLLRPKAPGAPSTVQFPASGGGGGTGGPPAPTAGLPCITADGKIGATDANGNCVALAAPVLPDGSPCLTTDGKIGTISLGACVAPAPSAPAAGLPCITSDGKIGETDGKGGCTALASPNPAPAPSAATVSAGDVLTWQNLFLTLPQAAQTFNTWVQDAPAALRSTLSLAQLQQIYNYYAAGGGKGLSIDQLVAQINGWLAKPSTIPTVPTSRNVIGVAGTGNQAAQPQPIVNPYSLVTGRTVAGR